MKNVKISLQSGLNSSLEYFLTGIGLKLPEVNIMLEKRQNFFW